MDYFTTILAQILLSVVRGSVDMKDDSSFSANDVIFANKLLRQTIQSRRFLNDPIASTLTIVIGALYAQDPELYAWTEKEIRERGATAFTKHLWITYSTM